MLSHSALGGAFAVPSSSAHRTGCQPLSRAGLGRASGAAASTSRQLKSLTDGVHGVAAGIASAAFAFHRHRTRVRRRALMEQTGGSEIFAPRRQLVASAGAAVGICDSALPTAADDVANSRTPANHDWRQFPDKFLWGVATAAFQVEGGANESGKGLSIWDTFSHVPGTIIDDATADVACDHLHRLDEDVNLLKQIGAKAYRFSISWPRILPTGTLAGGVNEYGFQFYESLCQKLLANGIEPVATLYHWDLPQALEDQGGWLERSTVDAFGEYAKLCFDRLGGYIKIWCTINEPWTQCVLGYCFGSHAPGRAADPGVEPYLAGHHMLLAHSVAVKRFRAAGQPGAKIAMVLNTEWFEAQDPNSPEDVGAAQRALAFNLGWFADPLYKGDYPPVMRQICGDRLPHFTNAERLDLHGSNDYFAVNNYDSRYAFADTAWKKLLSIPSSFKLLPYMSDVMIAKVKSGLKAKAEDMPTAGEVSQAASRGGPTMPRGLPTTSYLADVNSPTTVPLNADLTATGWPVSHYGLGRLLMHIETEYKPLGGIIVTEGGAAFTDEEGFQSAEDRRRRYLRDQTVAVKRALDLGVDVRGYFWWTFMDNFEWSYGYSKPFGLFEVDFAGGSLARNPRAVAKEFENLVRRNAIRPDVTFEQYLKCLNRPDGR